MKFGKSDKAKTHAFPKEEGVKYHLAWVSYAPTSGKFWNATYSQRHLKLRTQLQKDLPSPKEAGGLYGRRGHGDHPYHLLVSGPGGWLLGLGDDHRRGLSHTKHSPVPFLVLHRVRAGEGNIKAIPCPFLGVTPS